MKKTLQLAALLLAGFSATAQDLAYKIPKNATAVASLQTDQLFQLLSIPEFEQSKMGRQLMKGIGGGSRTSLRDLGISLSAPMYYYNRRTDSISYHCVLIPVEDASKLDGFIRNKLDASIARLPGMRMIADGENSKSVLVWNDEMLLFVSADLKSDFFEQDEQQTRYGRWSSEYPYEETTVVAVDSVSIEDATAVVVGPLPAKAVTPKEGKKGAHQPKHKKQPSQQEIIASQNELEKMPEAVQEEVPALDRNKLSHLWALAYAEKVMRKSDRSASILDHEAFISSRDNHAVASLYIANMQGVYGDFLNGLYGRNLSAFMKGYGNLSANLYLDENKARLTTQLELNDRMAGMYRRIYNHSVNPEFVKYINSDRLVGFMGYAIDTKAYLEEFPKMMKQTYGRYLGMNDKYGKEMDLGADLLSLLLDEEAVAQVVKGDALLVFNGVSSHEVTYKSYEYNDSTYERNEIEKTKTETLPDFLYMMSSDDTRLIRKLLNYGIDKGEIKWSDGVYSLGRKSLKSPMPIHLTIKNGIIFIGTSLREMRDIYSDRFEGSISKGQKKLILDNNMSIFFNPRNLHDRIPAKEVGSLSTWTRMNDFLGNSGVVYAKSNGIEGNIISGEIVAEVPEGSGNALQYFFSLIEGMNK